MTDTKLTSGPIRPEIIVGRITATSLRNEQIARFRYTNHGPEQTRSLTPTEQRQRATRPDLWPAFVAPPEEVPAVDDLDRDGEWLASVDPDDLDSVIDAHMTSQ